MGFNVLERSCNGILRLRLEAESNDPPIRRYRHGRNCLCGTGPAHVVDLHRVNGGRLVAGSAGILRSLIRRFGTAKPGGITADQIRGGCATSQSSLAMG